MKATDKIEMLVKYYEGLSAKARLNIEVYLSNSVGIGDHSNIVEAIEKELNMISKYQDQIDVINKYFKK